MKMHVYLLACSTAAVLLSRGARMEGTIVTTESTGTTEEVGKSVVDRGEGGGSNPWAVDNDYYPFRNTKFFFEHYMSVVPFCALLTNGLAVYVFLHRGKTDQTVDMLLIASSISDIFSLVNFMDTAVYFWTDHEWSFQKKTDVGCRMILYITNVARDCSSYFILTFTVDRFVAVWFPLKRSTIMTKKRVQLIMVSIVLLGLTMEVYVPIINKSKEISEGENMCVVRDARLNATLLSYLRNTLGFIVPGVAVAILNALIIVRMRKYEAQRAVMTSGDGEHNNSSHHPNRSLTIMLVTASTFSFLCGAPKTIYFIYLSYADWAGWVYITYAYVVDMILVINYTCNFFFYCMSGSQFRRDLVQALCRRGEEIAFTLLKSWVKAKTSPNSTGNK